MLPSTIPLFPLPTVVLFPNVLLPLHIFEPRYRQMVNTSLGGDRLIGMVLLQPGYEADYEGTPRVYDVGCAGSITHVERLSDGRFNIVLRGVEKFRIVGEREPSDAVLYRLADIEPMPERIENDRRAELKAHREKLDAFLTPLVAAAPGAHLLPQDMADEDVINALSQYLELEPLEKQALLQIDGPVSRSQALLELLEMKTLANRGLGGGGHTH